MSRMNAKIVASEKCWGVIEEKIPEISREVNWMYWLRIGHVSTTSGKNTFRSYLKILRDEKSWTTWKSNQKIVMDEKLVDNVVMDEEWL